jgi:hypothetical protein
MTYSTTTEATMKKHILAVVEDNLDGFAAYAKRVEELEAEGLTTSDAQGIADMEQGSYGRDAQAVALAFELAAERRGDRMN